MYMNYKTKENVFVITKEIFGQMDVIGKGVKIDLDNDTKLQPVGTSNIE